MEFNSPMARQFNGPVIDSLLNARHNVFNESEEFMLHRQGLTLENATTEELNLIGKFLCIPRPYAMINGEPEYCDDTFYRIYIRNLAILRQSQSIYDLARMFDQFMPDGRYFVSFQPNGDLLVVLDEQYIAYTPFFQKALDSVFTALPRINTLESWDFDKFVYQHRLYTRLISLTNSDWVFGIEYRSHACLWLAVGTDHDWKGCIIESTDGVNWTKQNLNLDYSVYGIHYADNKWIAVGYHYIYASEDGRAWTIYDIGDRTLRAVYYYDGLWVAVGYHNNKRNVDVFTSTDTEYWTQQDTSTFSGFLHSVSYIDGKWVAVGGDRFIITSDDGITWQGGTNYSFIQASYYVVADIDGTALAVGSNGNAVVSTDMTSWGNYNLLSLYGHDLYGICKNANRYTVVGSYGTVLEGSSVSDWTVRTTEQISATFVGIDYFNGKWVVVSEQGEIYTSPDLVNWTLHSVEEESLQNLNAIAHAPIDIREGTYATVVSPSGKLTVNNHIATATIERRT